MNEAQISAIFAADPRVTKIREFSGWVPNAYKWRCRRKAFDHYPTKSVEVSYDAKRSGGKGPSWVAYSDCGGRLFSA